jgi:type IV secretory pathway protease TraF
MRRLLRKPAVALCAVGVVMIAESAGQRVVSGLVLDADSKQPVGMRR